MALSNILPVFNRIKRSYFFDNETTLPGNSRIYLLEKKDFVSYSVNSDGVVNNINYRNDWMLLEGLRTISFDCEPDVTRSGVLYKVNVSFLIPTLSTIKTQLIDILIQGEYVVVIRDRNYRFWVFGLDESVRYDKSKFGSTVDSNLYEVRLGTTQRINQLEVTRSYMNGINVSAFMDDTELPVYTSVNYYNYTTPTGAGSTTGFKSVTYPPNNFVLTDETFALVPSGQTIYLPISPRVGQQITIKDTGDGDNNPVIIKPSAARAIDGEAEGYVNTNKGSVTIVFVDNKWNTIQ